mgnify:CR=1 FL=1
MTKDIIDKIVQKFNSEDVIKFSDKDGFKDVKSWAHTGSPTLDYNLHTFGLPTGKYSNLYGDVLLSNSTA